MKVIGSMRDSEKSKANRSVRSLLTRLDGQEIRRDLPVPLDTDLLIQWGFKPTVALLSAIELGVPYIILDLGYFDDGRYGRYSVSINGFHGTAWRDPSVLDRAPRPAPSYVDWQPMEKGERIVVMGQMPGDQSLRGQDIEAWMGRTAVACAEHYKLPVHKRTHPKMLNPWESEKETLAEALDNCFLCVTWTSTAAVQSLLAGVPTVAMHKGSMARVASMAPDHIVRDPRPGRQAWVHELSWREWDFDSEADLDSLSEYIITTWPVFRAGYRDDPRVRL